MNFIKNIIASRLFKVSSLNTVSVLVKIAGGLISSKIIALFIGPAGLALVGNLRNFLTSVDSFSMLGFHNGIIKYVAENEKDEEKLFKVLATVFLSILGVIALLSMVLLLLSDYWSIWIFNDDPQYAWVFKVLAFSLPWYTGNMLFVSVLNGLGKYKQVISINIWGNITGVLLSALIIWKLQTPGAMLALIISPAILFLFSFYLVRKEFPAFRFLRWKNFSYPLFKGLLSYSYMSAVTALLGPIVYLVVRNNLMQNHGLDAAGFWEAMNRISVFYLLFVSTLLTVYFLPKLSISTSAAETKKIFYSYYKGIIPVFVLGIILIYFLRRFIVQLILTDEFLPMTDLFFWQLLGDFFKACSLILGYEFYAKKMTKAFIATEILSFATLFASSNILIARYGAEGAVMAHAFTYLAYLVVLVIYFRKKLF